jgi:malate synthase
MAAWLGGSGAVAIDNLMEDVATAEISRAQLWQWVRFASALAGDGVNVGAARLTSELYEGVRDAELAKLARAAPEAAGRLRTAAELLDAMVLADGCAGFLTLAAYERLVEG